MYNTHLQLNALVNNVVANHPVISAGEIKAVANAQLRIIQQEFNGPGEMCEGIATDNLEMIRDGFGDVIVTFDGLLHRLALSSLHPGNVSGRETYEDVDFGELTTTVPVTAIAPALRDMQQILDQLKAFFATERPAGNVYDLYQPFELQILKVYTERFYRCLNILACYYDIPVMQDQFSIFESNMSKFDRDLETAQQGTPKYLSLGLNVNIEPVTLDETTYYVIKSSEDQTGTDGKDYPKGKFLKGVNFYEPRFGPMHERVAAASPIASPAGDSVVQEG